MTLPQRFKMNVFNPLLKTLRGDRVVVTARLIKTGATLVFAIADVADSAGTLCARGDGVIAVAGTDTAALKASS